MARATFGGTAGDFVSSVGPGKVVRVAPATLTIWSAKTGGSQITDLLLNGSPVTSIPVGSDGQVPAFQGPDGVSDVWADAGGGSRVRLVPDITGALANPDSTVKTLIQNPASDTAAALSAAIQGQVGPVADDVTDIQAQINAWSGVGVFKGAWSAGSYVQGDMVTNGGVLYGATGAAVAGDVPGTASVWAALPTTVDSTARADLAALTTTGRVPRLATDDSTTDAIRWRSLLGRRILARLSRDGLFTPAKGIKVGTSTLTAATRTDYAAGTRLPVTGLAHKRLAEDALNVDGTVPAWVLARWAARMPVPSSPKGRGIICRGDSLTAGAFGDGVSYPQRLSILCPGIPIAKRGNPGEKSKEISMRQGSTALTVNADLTVPASGATAAFAMNTSQIFTNPNGTNGTPDGLAMTGTLGGIRGTLTATGGMFTFTRASAGDAATVPAGTPWQDEWESVRRDWNQIIWVGRNNVTATPSDAALYAAKIAAYQTSGDYVVLSVTNATAEPSGSANYTTIQDINAALASAHGSHYFDLRAWLIADGLAAVGITPTSDDTTAISEDRIPPSLLAADGLHFNADGYRATAIAVHDFINGRGWL